MELMTPYQTEVVGLLNTGLSIVTVGLAFLLCLVAFAVVRHL